MSDRTTMGAKKDANQDTNAKRTSVFQIRIIVRVQRTVSSGRSA